MRAEQLLTLLIGIWVTSVLVSIGIAVMFQHLFFAGYVIGSVVTVVIAQRCVQYGARIVADSAMGEIESLTEEMERIGGDDG